MVAVTHGLKVDTQRDMSNANAKHVWTDTVALPATNQRAAERRSVTLPGRITWTDQRGTLRFATVVTRDVSEYGVYVECQSAVPIPLYRLVHFPLERDVHPPDTVPDALRRGRVLSAVYRVSPSTSPQARHGLALRLMVEPKRLAATGFRVFSSIGPVRAS